MTLCSRLLTFQLPVELERLRNEFKHAQENEASAKEMLAKSKVRHHSVARTDFC